MANKTIALTSEIYSGTSGLKLYLINPSSGAIGNNASGDTLTAGSNGLFTTVVDEAITGWWKVVVRDASGNGLIEGEWVYILSDSVGTYVVESRSDLISAIADGVWDEPYAGHTTAGSFGKLLDTIRKANLTIDGTVSNAITPTTTTFASDVVAVTSAYAHAVLLFVSGPLEGENSPIINYTSANGVFVLEEPLTAAPSNGDEFVVIAGSHVHAIVDIQSGLATTTQLTTVEGKIDAIDGVADKLDTTLELDGAVYRFTTNALEQAPSGGGGGGGGSSIMVTPVVSQTPVRVIGQNISTFIGDLSTITVGVFSGSDPVDLSGFGDLEVCVQARSGVDLDFVPMADLTISGTDSNYVSWDPAGPSVADVVRGKWSLRKTSNKQVIAYGAWIVEDAALEDTGS